MRVLLWSSVNPHRAAWSYIMGGSSYQQHRRNLWLQSLLLWYSLDVQNTKTTSPIFHSSHVMLAYKMVAYTTTQKIIAYTTTQKIVAYTTLSIVSYSGCSVFSIHSNIPLCKTERKLTINITISPRYITPSQFTKKYLPEKKKFPDMTKK